MDSIHPYTIGALSLIMSIFGGYMVASLVASGRTYFKVKSYLRDQGFGRSNQSFFTAEVFERGKVAEDIPEERVFVFRPNVAHWPRIYNNYCNFQQRVLTKFDTIEDLKKLREPE
jgi:hypothetical protein